MVRPEIEEVRVYSPTPANREKFAATWSERTGRRIVAVDEPRGAVEGCRIVTCATAAMDPCFEGAWLEPGSHVTAITSPDGTATRRELDDATFDRADRVVVLSREQVHHDKQYDILGPVHRGRMSWDDIRELGDLLAGSAPGRGCTPTRSRSSPTTPAWGCSSPRCAPGHWLSPRSAASATRCPTDWFLEETSP